MVTVEFTQDQALVLGDWLSKFTATIPPELDGTAEEIVLWHLEGALERQIDCLLSPSYPDELAQAKRRILAP